MDSGKTVFIHLITNLLFTVVGPPAWGYLLINRYPLAPNYSCINATSICVPYSASPGCPLRRVWCYVINDEWTSKKHHLLVVILAKDSPDVSGEGRKGRERQNDRISLLFERRGKNVRSQHVHSKAGPWYSKAHTNWRKFQVEESEFYNRCWSLMYAKHSFRRAVDLL